MDEIAKKFDFWYAAANTEVVLPPSRHLETFGSTLINYHLAAELPDDPSRVRIREGRLEAARPSIITPEAYARTELQGFGTEAKKYLDFLKQHEDSIRILQYGYRLRQESFSEQVVTDSLAAVLDRITAAVKAADDGFAAVVKGVDDPWDVCLVRLFWLEINASAPVNIRELEAARLRSLVESTPLSVREDVERAFAKAAADPKLVRELGAFLQRKGIFEQYQDRFFKLVRQG